MNITHKKTKINMLHLETHLNITHSVSLLVDVLAVGDHLVDLSALEEIQLQQLRHILTEVDCIQHTQ